MPRSVPHATALASALSRKALLTAVFMSVLVAASLIWARHAHAEDKGNKCATPTVEEVTALLNDWKAQLANGNAERLSALYSDDATIVPSSDGQPQKGKQAIRAYYADLIARHPSVQIKSTTMVPGCNSAVVSGTVLYRVTGTRKGTRNLLGGSYKAELALQSGTWRIVRQTLATDPKTASEVMDSSRL